MYKLDKLLFIRLQTSDHDIPPNLPSTIADQDKSNRCLIEGRQRSDESSIEVCVERRKRRSVMGDFDLKPRKDIAAQEVGGVSRSPQLSRENGEQIETVYHNLKFHNL